jgi:hypothetical protein
MSPFSFALPCRVYFPISISFLCFYQPPRKMMRARRTSAPIFNQLIDADADARARMAIAHTLHDAGLLLVKPGFPFP